MVYLILIIFFLSHLFLFRKSVFLTLKTSKISKKWLLCSDTMVSGVKLCRWKWRFTFISFDKKYSFCSVCRTRFWLKSVSFSFSYLHYEKHINFWNVFQVYKRKRTFLKHFQVYNMNKTRFWSVFFIFTKRKKHVFELFLQFTTWKPPFWIVFELKKWKNTFLKRF